ncbi:hypothetical protein EAG_03527 [Camponotus floridanus]|uniref:Uncharacterized protein n=1 Tax=Camponotus floridanus TaxID=104421 RepID=E2A1U9_CAMFO|nr:hypothetical protein EAG_03527 [Camponotus floridanus]
MCNVVLQAIFRNDDGITASGKRHYIAIYTHTISDTYEVLRESAKRTHEGKGKNFRPKVFNEKETSLNDTLFHVVTVANDVLWVYLFLLGEEFITYIWVNRANCGSKWNRLRKSLRVEIAALNGARRCCFDRAANGETFYPDDIRRYHKLHPVRDDLTTFCSSSFLSSSSSSSSSPMARLSADVTWNILILYTWAFIRICDVCGGEDKPTKIREVTYFMKFTRKGKRIFRMGSHEERHVHNPSLHGDSADQAYALCIVHIGMSMGTDVTKSDIKPTENKLSTDDDYLELKNMTQLGSQIKISRHKHGVLNKRLRRNGEGTEIEESFEITMLSPGDLSVHPSPRGPSITRKRDRTKSP